MKNEEIRQELEGEILRLKSKNQPLSADDFEKYLFCLRRLCELNVTYALGQEQIISCACGEPGDFVGEFCHYVSPLLQKMGKEINLDFVHEQCTNVFFSPRLTEIALGCMLGGLMGKISLSVISTGSAVAVVASGRQAGLTAAHTQCIGHVARLHGGQFIVCHDKERIRIVVTFPCFQVLKPLRIVPCSTEICRLCAIFC